MYCSKLLFKKGNKTEKIRNNIFSWSQRPVPSHISHFDDPIHNMGREDSTKVSLVYLAPLTNISLMCWPCCPTLVFPAGGKHLACGCFSGVRSGTRDVRAHPRARVRPATAFKTGAVAANAIPYTFTAKDRGSRSTLPKKCMMCTPNLNPRSTVQIRPEEMIV